MTDDITPEILLNAYAIGVFPMAETRDDPEIHWVEPRARGVFELGGDAPLGGFHVSRSLLRHMRNCRWRVEINRDFAATLDACADRAETWISGRIRALYLELHAMGHAHSIELREGDALIGGSYGVTLGGGWFGESMFSRRTNASKVALAFCVDHLRAQGFTLFDTQFLTPHLASLGGTEIAQSAYRRRLATALGHQARFDAGALAQSSTEVSSSSLVSKLSSGTSSATRGL